MKLLAGMKMNSPTESWLLPEEGLTACSVAQPQSRQQIKQITQLKHLKQ